MKEIEMFLVNFFYINTYDCTNEIKQMIRLVFAGDKELAEQKAEKWFDKSFNKEKLYKLNRIDVFDTIS